MASNYEKMIEKEETKREETERVKNKRQKEEDEIREFFSDRFTSAQESVGKNDATVSRETGVNQSMIGSYSKGKKAPSVYTAKYLAKYFGVSLDWLCGDDIDSRTELNSNDVWLNIPIAYALLAILNKFSPKIDIGDGINSPHVTLSFNYNKLYYLGDKTLKDFFKAYEPITILENSNCESDATANAVDTLLKDLAKTYKDIL